MSRLRALACVVVLVVAGLLVPATAATAVTRLIADITCDRETGAITTRVSGTLLQPAATGTPVTVEFQRRSGIRVTATTSTSLPRLTPPFTVNTTTTSSGDITASGYTGTFDPASSLYYREVLVATFRNTATGATYATREATCEYDQRTTVTMTCDPAAHTLTATATGINGQAGAADGSGRPTRIGYHIVTIVQGEKGGPRFRGETLGGVWDVEHRLTQAADGTWTDTGFVHTYTRDQYYYAEEVTVGVFDAYGKIVGGGFATCVLIDGSVTPTA
jgi:hypothetical protein